MIIPKNVLTDFLRKNRAEVLRMSLFYYDEEKHIQQERDESYEDGKREGKKEGIQIGEEKIIITMHNNGLSLEDIAAATGKSIKEVKEIIG